MKLPRDLKHFGTKHNKDNNADVVMCSRKKAALFPKLKSNVHRTVWLYVSMSDILA